MIPKRDWSKYLVEATPLSEETPLPEDVIYSCDSCYLRFDTVTEGKHHFRTSSAHTQLVVPRVTGDSNYDADLAAIDMITVMAPVPVELARRIKRKADRNEKRHEVKQELARAPKKARVLRVDVEDNRNIQNVFTDCDGDLTIPDSRLDFGMDMSKGQDLNIKMKDNRNIQNVFTGCTPSNNDPESSGRARKERRKPLLLE